MKSLIILSLALISLTSYAHGIKRLTTTTCTSEDSSSTIIVKYDSSITPFGPVEILINEEEVNPIMELGGSYLGLEGRLKNGSKFYATVKPDSDSKSVLKINDAETELTCNTKTKFRPY